MMIRYCAYNEERICNGDCVSFKKVDTFTTTFENTPFETTRRIKYTKCQRGNFFIEGEE